MPIYGFLFLIVAMSSAGLPGLNGFVGEINILIGAFQTIRPFAILGTLGIILAAWYLLSAVRQMLHGPLEQARERGDLRSEAARGAGAGAARDPVLRHRPFPEHFL